MATVWLDEDRCTQCGACVEVCPSSALAWVVDKVSLDVALCRGCEACVEACPVGALKPVLEIEPVPVPAAPQPQAPAPVAPVAQDPGLVAKLVAVGADLLVRAAPVVLRSVGRLLSRPRSVPGTPSSSHQRNTSALSPLGRGRGRQARHRRRGR